MAEIKSFDFGGKREEDDELVAGQFMLNGELFSVLYQETANLALLVAAVNNASDGTKVISKIVDFMDRALVDGDAERFERTVLDAQMKIENVVDIFKHVLSLVAADRPTGPSKPSSQSPRKTGTRSTGTARSAASTH